MKPIEVFVKYCKLKGIMSHIKNIENYGYSTEYKYTEYRNYKKTFSSITDSLSRTFKNKGFFWMFCDLECLCWSRITECNNYLYHNEDYVKASKSWRRFVRNNVKLKNEPKKGDIVKISHRDNEFLFDGFSRGYKCIDVINQDFNYKATYDVNFIESINGEDFKMDFYIKFNGKTYE